MKVLLKELGEIITGNTPSKKTEEFWNSEDICFVKPDIIAGNGVNEIMDSNEYISEEARKKARVVGKNSIFITCIGSIGKIGIASDGEYAFNQQINAIIPNDRVQAKYLAYNLLFNKPRLVAIANAPVVPIINKGQFGEFTVNVETDIDRQSEIVDVLDKLTQIIQQRNKEISALDNLIKARFVELFVDKGYPMVSIDDLSMGKGEYGAQSAAQEFDSNRPRYVRITDINDDGTLNNDAACSSNPDDDEQYKLSYGDFLFARMGATVGKTYAFKTGNEIFAGYLIRYRLNMKMVLPEYLYAYTKLEEYWAWVKNNQSGAAQPGINAKKYGSMEIPVAPIDKQIEFQQFVEQVDKSKLLSGCRLFHSWAPENRDKPKHVGMPRQKTKGLRGDRRQQ